MVRRRLEKKILFIEGTTDGNLSRGFTKLLSKVLAGRMPKIIMGNDKHSTIRKFRNNRLSKKSYLLVDLDASSREKEEFLKEEQLESDSDNVFFMIQEMESWFISQPQTIIEVYGRGYKDNFSNKVPQEIPKPSEKLAKAVKGTQAGKYMKVQHAIKLLENLDARKLMDDFSEFNRLVEQLKVS